MAFRTTAIQTLTARHSLPGNEAFHEHLWTFEVLIESPFDGSEALIQGKLIDISLVQRALVDLLSPLQETDLNHNPYLDRDWVRETPTCEGLAFWAYHHLQKISLPVWHLRFPKVSLSTVKVWIADRQPDGTWKRLGSGEFSSF